MGVMAAATPTDGVAAAPWHPWQYALLLQDFRAVRMFLRDLRTLAYGVAKLRLTFVISESLPM